MCRFLCGIRERKKKMAKNKMTGFFMTVGNKGIFLESSLEKKSKTVVEGMIDAIGKLKGAAAEVIAQCKADRQSYEKIQYDMTKATLEYITTQGGYQYMSIYGDNFTENFPPENYGDVVIIKEGDLDKIESHEKVKSVGLQIGLGSMGYYAHNPRTRSTKEQLNYYQLIQLIAEYMIKHPDRTVEPIHKADITNERLNNMIIVAKNGMLGNTFESQKNLSRGNNIVVNYGRNYFW